MLLRAAFGVGDLLLEAYDDQAFTNSITDILTVLEPLLAGQIENERFLTREKPMHTDPRSPKMSQFFQFWHFLPIFGLLKLTCLVTLFDRERKVFKSSPN